MKAVDNSSEEEFVDDSPSQDEAEIFLGKNPSAQESEQILLREDLVERIKIWTKIGLNNKEERENLLLSIPRRGQLNLEAPTLNEEIAVDLHPRALAKDDHFKDYQNLTGTALTATSYVLSMILNDSEVPLDREVILRHLSNAVKLQSDLFFSLTQARKTFLLGRFEEKIQKILKKIEPTTLLFGDNLKSVIETSRAVERVSKDLKPKASAPLTQNNSLNWRSSTVRKELGRGATNYDSLSRAHRGITPVLQVRRHISHIQRRDITSKPSLSATDTNCRPGKCDIG